MNNRKISLPLRTYIISLIGTGILLVFMLWFIAKLVIDGLYPLASALAVISVFICLVFVQKRFSPYRWLGLGFALALLFTMYPIVYTLFLSVTNMGSGHLMTKQQAIKRLEQQSYLPEDADSYQWTSYQAPDGEYALWLVAEDGTGLLAKPGEPIVTGAPGQGGVGELDADGVPVELEGYRRLERKDTLAIINDLGEIDFGEAPNTIRVVSMSEASELKTLYQYDPDQDAIIDQETGEIYHPILGTFTSDSGETLTPGYIVNIGSRHFRSFIGNKGLRQPLSKIIVWNFTFAFLSVFLSFAIGIVVALMFEDLVGKRIIRALLIIPWPIPVLVSVLIWRSMLHPDLGFVAVMLESMFGSSPAWFQNPTWTRFALVMVNVWLSYPYFSVITAGALRAIPEEITDAAIVDGAGPWKHFYHITLPLLLQILTPLLIASFTFNFNNFNVIYIFNFGDPPMPNTVIPMGYTDILISFVYRLAFITTNVTNYGLAAAITIMLFFLISIMVILQVRLTNIFEERN